MDDLQVMLEDAMQRQRVPGLSFALVRAGRLHVSVALGIRGAHDRTPADAHTVFEAASLTKPLVAFIALQLVDQGRLDLHQPLVEICGDYVPDDPRSRAITTRHVLCHITGLPNVVGPDKPLRTHFAPGERFSYGSSAFAWLQRALETITGRTLEELAAERVFAPSGMVDSSLVWQERFEANHAEGQEWEGEPVPKRRVSKAQASWSLLTTAPDYARFLEGVFARRGLSADMHARWFEPLVFPRQGGNAEDLPGEHPPDPAIAWSLGWGIERTQACFFHWGHSPGFRALVIGNRRTSDAVVWFANAARGLRLAHAVLPAVMPGEHPLVHWMQIGT